MPACLFPGLIYIKNWSYRVLDFISNHGLSYCNIDSGLSFHNVKKDLVHVLNKISVTKWSHDVNQIQAKRGKGENKLRTYRLFKHDFNVEPYVYMHLKKSHRRALALFRSGTAPINIELLRYGVNQVPVVYRKCISCNAVESECHVLTQCSLYNDIRDSFYCDLQQKLS